MEFNLWSWDKSGKAARVLFHISALQRTVLEYYICYIKVYYKKIPIEVEAKQLKPINKKTVLS